MADKITLYQSLMEETAVSFVCRSGSADPFEGCGVALGPVRDRCAERRSAVA